ncbi:MAG: hypothetical protein K6T66_10150 [Peptococcaceae bacterium]|nr:hypothetical protein [Peptococcaceae bacterium]
MSDKKNKLEKEDNKDLIEAGTGKEDIETGEWPEEEEDYFEEDDEEYEYDTETEIEHQTPEVIAKEILITYLETNAFAQPEARRNENRYQAVGRALGEMYNSLLEEIRKTER